MIYIFLLCVMLLCFFCAAARANESINIAVIADKATGLDLSPFVSLLETKLSQAEGIKVLERAQIEKILQEQQLSLAGLLDRDAIIETGRLLRADAFILLSQENTKAEAEPTQPVDETIPQAEDSPKGQLIRIRVSGTTHGLRLLDKFEELDDSRLEEVTERIIKDINAITGKLSIPAGQAIPVGIVDIHRVQLGERYKMLERALPVLLSVRLSKEPKIIMLEREDLKVLLEEKLITEGDESEFWGSALLIDGHLQPSDGGMEMTLHLRQGTGQEIATLTVPVEPNEPSLAIEDVSNEIINRLQDSPPVSQWRPELEAEEFYQQGQLLSAHSRYEDAVSPLETAHALQPRNVFYTGAIFTNEWEAREKVNAYLYPQVYYSNQELAEIVSLLVRQISDGCEKGLLTKRDIRYKWARNLGTEMFPFSYFTTTSSVSTEQIRKINQSNRKMWTKTVEQIYNLRREYDYWNWKVNLVWIGSDDPKEIFTNMKLIFNKCCMPLELGGIFESTKMRNKFYNRSIRVPIMNALWNPERTHLGEKSEIFSKLWLEFLVEMTHVDDPVIKFNAFLDLGRANICECNNKLDKDNIVQADYYISNALRILTEGLQWSDESYVSYQEGNIKSINYVIKRMDTELVKKVSIWESIFEPLIENGNVVDLALWDPGYLVFGSGEMDFPSELNEAMLRYYRLLERSALVLQSSKGDPLITRALNNIRDAQAEIRSRYSQTVSVDKQLNLSVNILLSQDDFLNKLKWRQSLMPMLLKSEDNVLWVAIMQEPMCKGPAARTNIGLARIDLGEKKLASLWNTEFSYIRSGFVELTGIIDYGAVTYLSIKNVGIVEFPGNNMEGYELLQEPKILTREDGLPSISITSMYIEDENKLWIAYGDRGEESGLGFYNPMTGQWETIFCSTLKGEPPFCSGRPYQIYSLMRVPPDKLFFFAYDLENSGLWKMNIKSRELQYLVHAWGDYDFFGDTYIGSITQNIFVRDAFYIIKFYTDSEKVNFVLGDKKMLLSNYGVRKVSMPDFQEELFVPESFQEDVGFGSLYLGLCDLSTAAIYDNKLWARFGRKQLLIVQRGKSFEEAKIIDNDILDGGPVSRFVSTPYGLVAIGEGVVGLVDTENIQD